MLTADDCYARFMEAVRAARNDDFRPGNRLIREVRERYGDEAAKIQQRELRNYTDSKKEA